MRRLTVLAGRVVPMLAILALAACTAIYRNHGYAPSDDDLAQITVGKDTRETVAELVGLPSARGMLNDTGYYYVQSRWKEVTWHEPEEIDRQVIAITFNASGIVDNVGRYTLQDGRVIALSRRVTDSNIKGVSFIRQLLGNVGNFRAQDILPSD